MRTFKSILFILFFTIAYSENILSISSAEIASGESVDLDVSDFSDDGADLDELRDIIEGGL